MSAYNLKEFEVLILLKIAENGSYGYKLLGELPSQTRVTPSRIYHALRKLEQLNLIKAQLLRQDAAPIRRYYRLTRSGKLATEQQAVQYIARLQAEAKKRLTEYRAIYLSLQHFAHIIRFPASDIPYRKLSG